MADDDNKVVGVFDDNEPDDSDMEEDEEEEEEVNQASVFLQRAKGAMGSLWSLKGFLQKVVWTIGVSTILALGPIMLGSLLYNERAAMLLPPPPEGAEAPNLPEGQDGAPVTEPPAAGGAA